MAYCPDCRKHFREPEDEQGEHGCPKCGRGPGPEEKESDCQKPCHPDSGCEECAGYWQKMINEGYWNQTEGRWTNKGWREITK